MPEMLSPGTYVQEIDGSQITPSVSNSTCAFAGNFNLGTVGALTLNTSVSDLISNHGYPDDNNFNDWFQAWNFLQYGNKLLISRAVNETEDGTGTINGVIEVGDETSTEIFTVNGEDIELDREYTIYKAPVEIEADHIENNMFIGNSSDYDNKELSIAFTNPAKSKLKIMSRNPGVWAEDLEICIVKPDSFYANSPFPEDHINKYAFEGILVDDLYEFAPSGTEFGIIIRYKSQIVEIYTVDTVKTAKDTNKRTTYVENVINTKSSYIFAKDNTGLDTVADTTLFYDVLSNEYVGQSLKLLHSATTSIQKDDIIEASSLFENKEELEIDIVIGNELDGGKSAKYVSAQRKDSISFIGANYESCVGVKSSVAALNLIEWRMKGDVSSDSMFSAVFGNYKYQYDTYNDVYRWVNLAGDIAGLRAQTTMNRASWWASAGLERGKIKNVTKFAFNPTQPMRDLLYKNSINPCVVFPGMGAVCWGQKTLYSKPSSFDRVNVRGLFNSLERSLSKMAKYQVMEFNDTFTRNRIISMIKPYLAGVQAGRGIQDFLVICDESNNTPQVIASNQLIVDIYIKPTYVAEFILLKFTNAGTNSFSSIVS